MDSFYDVGDGDVLTPLNQNAPAFVRRRLGDYTCLALPKAPAKGARNLRHFAPFCCLHVIEF